MNAKPLQPIHGGLVLLAGVKASNFDEEIRTHPQVIMWESQNEHWLNKDLPANTRAVFVTRFIGHNAFHNILTQARKRQITIFNPEGTGIIVRQVRELLNLNHKPTAEAIPMLTAEKPKTGGKLEPKLHKLHQFIDWNKGNTDNARALLEKSKELGITTTLASLAQFVGVERKKLGMINPRPRTPKRMQVATREVDSAVQMLDNAITELKEFRQFFVDTVAENTKLRTKLEKFRKFFED